MARHAVVCALVCAFLFVFAIEANATTFYPLTLEERAASADAIVLARCTAIETRRFAIGRDDELITYVTLDLEEVLKGAIAPGPIVVRQLGGSVGLTAAWVDGSPRYRVGERAIVFLADTGSGALTTAGLARGYWPLEDEGGRIWARQDAGAGSPAELPRRDVDAHRLLRRVSLDEVRAVVALVPSRRSPDAGPLPLVPSEMLVRPSREREEHDAFTFVGAFRWFESDDGEAVPIAVNTARWSSEYPDLTAAVGDALASWSSVEGSSFQAEVSGTADVCGWRQDGTSAVSVDCREDIAGAGCAGVIATAGPNRITSETRSIGGTVFRRIREADVVLNDGYCDLFASPVYLRYVLTHELGHAFGLGHSGDQIATMYAQFRESNGARGVTLAADDEAGIRALYPARLRLVASELPAGRVGEPYAHRLAAEGGAAPYAFEREAGELPSGVLLTGDGTLEGTPDAEGEVAFRIRVRDATGATAGAELRLRVAGRALAIATRDLPAARAGVVYAASFEATGGQAPYTWFVDSGQLPEGVTMSSSGVVSGRPVRRGGWSIRVRCTDARGEVAGVELGLTVSPSPIVVSSAEYRARSRELRIECSPLTEGATIDVNGQRVARRVHVDERRGLLRVRGSRRSLGFSGAVDVVLVWVGDACSEPAVIAARGQGGAAVNVGTSAGRGR